MKRNALLSVYTQVPTTLLLKRGRGNPHQVTKKYKIKTKSQLKKNASLVVPT